MYVGDLGETSFRRMKRKLDCNWRKEVLKEKARKRKDSWLCYIFSLATDRWKYMRQWINAERINNICSETGNVYKYCVQTGKKKY
jgi:hypothetical protein